MNGPGSVTLSGRVAAARRDELRDDPEPIGRGDRLEDLEPVLLVVAARARAGGPAGSGSTPSGAGRTRR